MTDLFALRRSFVREFDIEAPDTPEHNLQAMAMWETMLAEEWVEFQQALADYKQLGPQASQEQLTSSMAELTAEGVDVLNVLVGLLLSQGLPVETMTQAIHDANMRKRCNGQILRRADGKVLKPEGWLPADKQAVIQNARVHDHLA